MSGEFRNRSNRWRGVRELALDVAFLTAVGALVYSALFRSVEPPVQARAVAGARRAESPLPVDPVSLESAILQGSMSARVALIEYSDFECPYCGKFARETLPALEEKYIRSGKVLMAFRHYPLPNHRFAQKAAEAVECAGQQGRFWDMHSRLFQEPRQLAEADLRRYAPLLGLDRERFDACLDGTMASKVQADLESAKRLGITGTPTFFIGQIGPDRSVKVTERVVGSHSVASFGGLLDTALSAAR